MNIANVNGAEKVAQQFLIRIEEVKLKLESDSNALSGCPESGALRRASMELTRALTTMRKP